jgi:hypothetical protein
MKSEANRGVRMSAVLRSMFDKGLATGLHRLWFGAATRRSVCAPRPRVPRPSQAGLVSLF